MLAERGDLRLDFKKTNDECWTICSENAAVPGWHEEEALPAEAWPSERKS
jgi:hypothetical protein